MLIQTIFSGMFFFTVYVIAKFLIGLYKGHIKTLDEGNKSLEKMAKHLEEITNDRKERLQKLAKRKAEADKKYAYERGKREAIKEGKVTELKPQRSVNSYEAYKNGEAPVQYDRSQGFD